MGSLTGETKGEGVAKLPCLTMSSFSGVGAPLCGSGASARPETPEPADILLVLMLLKRLLT